MKLKNIKSILAIALCAVGLTAFAKPAAKLTNGEVTKNYAEEELYQLLVVDGLKDGDKLEFLQEVKVWNSDYSEQVYGFTAGSTIKAVVDKDGTVWDIDIAGQDAEIIDSIGTTAGFAKNYRFTNEDGFVSLSASVAGSFMAPVLEVCWDVEVTGVMKAEHLTVNMMDSITLKGKGCVYTTNNKIDSICDQTGQEIEAKDASSILGEGWYVYALDDDPPLPPLPPVTVDALSNKFAMDLTAGDRIAADEETLVVDPAWGKATTATVSIEGESSARTYTSASNDLWQTAALAAGRYTLALTAGDDNETAAFWKPGADWVIFDSSNITADVTFEADKTYLMLGTNTVNGNTLTVTDGAKFAYAAGAGFKGGEVAALPKRYGKKTVGDLYQIYEKIKGSKDNPWDVGVGVEAYTNGTDNLVIVGAGTIADLSEIPADVKRGIAAITVGDGVTDAAAGVFFGFDKVAVTLQDNWKGELPDEKSTWCGATNVELTRVPTAVKNVKVQQRYPWNGKVDVDFDLTGEGDVKVTVQVTVDGEKLKNPTVDGETTFDLGKGKELKDLRLTWDAKADFGDAEKHEKIKVKLSVEKAN